MHPAASFTPKLQACSLGGFVVYFNKLQGCGVVIHLPHAKDGIPGPKAIPRGDYWFSHGCYEYRDAEDETTTSAQAKSCLDGLYLEEGDATLSWV